jgi:hypothetical protein
MIVNERLSSREKDATGCGKSHWIPCGRHSRDDVQPRRSLSLKWIVREAEVYLEEHSLGPALVSLGCISQPASDAALA